MLPFLVFVRVVSTMASMATVSVKHVQQRAGEEQDEREVLHDVGPMLGPEEITRDQEKSPENPAASAAAAPRFFRAVMLMQVLSHRFFLSQFSGFQCDQGPGDPERACDHEACDTE